ncbi:MAG: amino acid adenylation domain-containing protein, partial [Acidobacteriia bacterium]|nr:amino acid adenylation domain-containing protein [Terriglobia bacterium]
MFKAGGVYLPLDPRHPAKRLYQVLNQSGCPLVLTTGEFTPVLSQASEDALSGKRPRVLQIEALLEQEQSEENLPPRCRPQDLAYVMYTSGSTGTPKGVMVEHIGMLNHIYAKISDTQLTEADVVAQNGPQCFDISIWQCFAALLVGGRVHIFNDEIAHEPALLLEQVERGGVSVLQLVPSMLREIIQQVESLGATRPSLSALRWLVPTGDALLAEMCRQWLTLYPDIPLLNTYGSTECSDDQCHYPIYQPPPSDYRLSIMPIGRPIPNMRAYVLDQMLSPVPVGAVGELYLGGIGVGHGYLNEEKRTAEVFILDPFAREPGKRLYKTGDLARYQPDGNIEFLGRRDHLAKIRGFRVELGEIEATLEQHSAVKEAVVLAREVSPGNKHLVAYVIPYPQYRLAEEQEVDHLQRTVANKLVRQLRSFLGERLPDYMIPSAFVLLEALPLNSNGKVDRRALPAPDDTRPELREAFVAPRTPIEEMVT